MRLVFLGTGAFAVPSLDAAVAAGHEVAAVVTQPDREQGRGRKVAPPPVKVAALRHGLPVRQPRRIREAEAVASLAALAPEILVVVAYGQILPGPVLELAPRGAVNLHASLLPRWRGAAPIQWAVAAGDEETGVTTMQLDRGLDTGPILLARRTPIGSEETAADLESRLAALGADLLVETLQGLAAGSLHAVPQDASRATAARLLEKEDGRIDWTLEARVVASRIRGFHPWPGAFTAHEGRALKVLRAREETVGPGPSPLSPPPPGTVTRIDEAGVLVACAPGTTLRLLEVQPESRAKVPATAFARGARLGPGARLG